MEGKGGEGRGRKGGDHNSEGWVISKSRKDQAIRVLEVRDRLSRNSRYVGDGGNGDADFDNQQPLHQVGGRGVVHY